MMGERHGYHVMVNFVTCLFNAIYNNNILLHQFKYPLSGQQMTDVEPVLHNHATAQENNSPCGGPSQYQMS